MLHNSGPAGFHKMFPHTRTARSKPRSNMNLTVRFVMLAYFLTRFKLEKWGKNGKKLERKGKETGNKPERNAKEPGMVKKWEKLKESGKNQKRKGKETGNKQERNWNEMGKWKETGKNLKRNWKETGKKQERKGKETGKNLRMVVFLPVDVSD